MTPTSTEPSLDPTPPADGIIKVSKLNLSLLVFAIVSIAAALYLSPIATPLRDEVQQNLTGSAALPAPTATRTPAAPASSRPPAPSSPFAPAPRSSAHPSNASRHPDPEGAGSSKKAAPAVLAGPSASPLSALSNRQGAGVRTVNAVAAAPAARPAAGSSPKPAAAPAPAPVTKPSTPAVPAVPAVPAAPAAKTKCWQFEWQQDAQAVYAANLSDPYGLDGAPGPYDSDGIACSDLAVDPTRSPSTPIGQYVPPKASADTKAAIVSSASAYYGFTEDGLPGDLGKFDALEAAAGKSPSSVGWYQSFDDTYRGDLVSQSWSRGALPLFTWMPMQTRSGTGFSLTTIARGDYDAYLRQFAGDIVRTNLPVVIRFGHEMNGGWYGWSAGRTDWNNSPEKYTAAWKHVWDVFQSVGANENAIWLWSPSRVDNLKPSATNGVTALAADYPGDQYVDWVGASVYLRHASTGSSYEASFGKTVDALTAVTTKPIFFAEVGAIETDGTADEAQLKSDFIHNTLTAFAKDRRIVGFLWNNNVSSQLVNGESVTNDWRFNSNPGAAQQFVTEIADPRFRTGLVTTD